jgi:hypothetical protein
MHPNLGSFVYLPASTYLNDRFFLCRVHSHITAALINCCEGIRRDALIPYLDPIVKRLLKLLNPTGENAKQPRRYVQEQAITTLAMVTDASGATFAKVSFYEFCCFSSLCLPLIVFLLDSIT